MIPVLRRSAGALALAILVGGAAHAPALAQDERPDLQIEIVGLDPNDPTRVRVRVTNVGKWWADHTTATVETTAPTRGNKVEEDVLDLDPKQQPQGPTDYKYEFTYGLAAACRPGVKVKASLSTAVTFNGNTEANANLGNNVAERELCPQGASAGNGGVATADASGGAVQIGDVNSGGNAGNAIGVGDTRKLDVNELGITSKPNLDVGVTLP